MSCLLSALSCHSCQSCDLTRVTCESYVVCACAMLILFMYLEFKFDFVFVSQTAKILMLILLQRKKLEIKLESTENLSMDLFMCEWLSGKKANATLVCNITFYLVFH